MSLVIAIKSCQRDRAQGFHAAIRQTWGSSLPEGVALRFFMGISFDVQSVVEPNEIVVPSPDDYVNLPQKTKQIAKWFVNSSFDHMFLCDNDTYIDIPKFVQIPWQDIDYAGCFGFWPTGTKMGSTFRYNDGQGHIYDPCHAWASGGYGYFLSRKAATYVAEMIPISWAEDLSVGQVLGPLIQNGKIKGMNLNYNDHSFHIVKSPRKPLTPERIFDYHKGARQ